VKIGQRSTIQELQPSREGNGSTRRWTREINGHLYSFTAVLMPSGERRYAVDVFNGYAGGPSWGCAWDRVHFVTVPAEQA
jgi:hypothetical protein